MKVLQINSFFTVGGPPRIVNGIYDVLKTNGHVCKIAGGRERMYVPEDSYQVGNGMSAYYNAVQARLFDNEGLCAKRATKALIQWIEEYDPDVIQLHNLHGYFINIELLFAYLKQSGKPIVWTLHDCWPMTGHCTHFDYIKCDKWKSVKGCYDCPQKKEYPTSRFLDCSSANFKRKKEAFCGVPQMTIVTVSEWLKARVRESFLGEYPVSVIPNGLDLDQFKPTYGNITDKLRSLNKKIILGVAQNWGTKKGYDDVIKLSTLLPQEYQVVMVGLTSKQKKDLSGNIVGYERTNNVNELAQIYTSATVFLNLSVEETMGLTTAEALACGTPAIVYNRTAVPEVIDDSCGWVVEPGQFDEIIKIVQMMDDKSAYTQACIDRARKYEKMEKYEEYLSLYKKLID